MVTIHIPNSLARQLENLAQRENRSVDEVAISILKDHVTTTEDKEIPTDGEASNPLDAIFGILDVEITDMSMTVKETVREYHRKKYDGID